MVCEVLCKKCEKKCILEIYKDEEEINVLGNECMEGESFGVKYFNDKKDIFTSIVRIKGADCTVVPVKSSDIVAKDQWVEFSKALSRIYVGAPIKMGDVVCKNVLNSGIDILCTKTVNKKIDK